FRPEDPEYSQLLRSDWPTGESRKDSFYVSRSLAVRFLETMDPGWVFRVPEGLSELPVEAPVKPASPKKEEESERIIKMLKGPVKGVESAMFGLEPPAAR